MLYRTTKEKEMVSILEINMNKPEQLDRKDLDRCGLELSKDIEKYERMGKKKRMKNYTNEGIDLIYTELEDVNDAIKNITNTHLHETTKRQEQRIQTKKETSSEF